MMNSTPQMLTALFSSYFELCVMHLMSVYIVIWDYLTGRRGLTARYAHYPDGSYHG